MPKLFQGLRNYEQVSNFIERIIYKDDRIRSSAYLVKMSYYYDHEADKPLFIENVLITLDCNGDWIWEYDWYEGQQNVIIYAVYGIDELDLQDNI